MCACIPLSLFFLKLINTEALESSLRRFGKPLLSPPLYQGFPGSSAGKESACNAGDPGSIPGSGRSPGEGIGYPHQ